MHDFKSLYGKYPDIIAQMAPEFTSHEFILKLARQNQALYIEALHTYRTNESPFMVVHGVLAQHLHACDDLIEHLGGVASRDIFGNSNGCGNWRKRAKS